MTTSSKLHSYFGRALERRSEAGVPVVLRVDEGMLHGYFALSEWAERARETVDVTISWIRERAAAAEQ